MEELVDLRGALADISNTLSFIRQELNELNDERSSSSQSTNTKANRKKLLTDEQKRMKSQSAWAKSTVPSAICSVHIKENLHDNDLLNVLQADNILHTRTPTCKFHPVDLSSSKLKTQQDDEIEPGPTTYFVQDATSSSRKRLQVAIFPRDARKIESGNHRNDTPSVKCDVHPSSESEEILEYEYFLPAGPSFGKAARFREVAEEQPVQVEDGIALLEVEKALKLLERNVTTAIMKKETSKPTNIGSLDVNNDNNSNEQLDLNKLDVLSTRFNPTMVKICPAPSKHERRVPPSPGPGSYNVDDQACSATRRGRGVATGTRLHYAHTRSADDLAVTNNHSQRRREVEERERARGPGCYDTQTSTTIGVLKFAYSEAKDSKALRLKHYFEEKASEARDFHDHQKLVTDQVFTKRIPAVSFGPPRPRNPNTSNTNTNSITAKAPGIAASKCRSVPFAVDHKRAGAK